MNDYPSDILAAVDPEGEEDIVVRSAISICGPHEARLAALSVLPKPLEIGRIEIKVDKGLTAEAEASIISRCKALGLDPQQVHFDRGKPHKVIARFVETHQIDLVCIGASERNEDEYDVGTNTIGVLRKVDADVFCCRKDLPQEGIRDVLVAIEMDDRAEWVLERANLFLEPFSDARMHILSVVPPFEHRSPLLAERFWRSQPVRELTERRLAATRDVLPQLLDRYEVKAETARVIEGVPSKVIKQEAAALGADLITMSTGERVGGSWHIGSTTNNVLHGCTTNLLAIRPSWER